MVLKIDPPWQPIYASDIVLTAESSKELVDMFGIMD